MAKSSSEVIIVGAGPVGLGLALDLGLRGIACTLVERRRELHAIPKGQNLTQRTLEHFQFWGVVDEIRAARLMPPTYPIGELTAYGDLTTPWWHASAGREAVRSYYSQANERLPQYQVEKVLRAAIEKLPNVRIVYDATAISLEQDAEGVRVEIEMRADGSRETLEAAYLVGCDGGRSMVRDAVGIARSGTDFDTKMALIVFRSRELHDKLHARFPERSTYRVMKPEHHGYWEFFGRIDVGEGWFFHAPVPVDADESYDFRALLYKAAGFEFACTFDHIGFWDLRVSVAERYRAGRVFIAGDAAHTHPPYGGFGLNNGLEDATNLGWKLAAVLKGYAGDTLLDSYSLERQPIFKETGEFFIASRIRSDDEFLTRYNPHRDLAEFEEAWTARKLEGFARAHEYEPHYEASPVIAGLPDGKSSARGAHSITARAGHHLTPQPLGDGRSTFDALGPDYTLLAIAADEADTIAFEKAAVEQGIPLRCVRDGALETAQAYGARLVLVRPDQYVVWAGDRAPEDVEALLRKAVGR